MLLFVIMRLTDFNFPLYIVSFAHLLMSTSEVQTFILDWVSLRIKRAALEGGSIRYMTDGKTISEQGAS